MYIRRHMEKTLSRTSRMFGAILVTGARQVVKTTMLQRVETDIPYVSRDDIKTFRVLKKLGNIEIGPGGVISLYDNLINLNEQNKAIPLSYI